MTRARTYPPFEVRRDEHGFAVAIARGGWDIVHLHMGSARTEQNIERLVARLNRAPGADVFGREP